VTESDLKVGFSPEARQWRRLLPHCADGWSGAIAKRWLPCVHGSAACVRFRTERSAKEFYPDGSAMRLKLPN
jgi:hypothetical protein